MMALGLTLVWLTGKAQEQLRHSVGPRISFQETKGMGGGGPCSKAKIS